MLGSRKEVMTIEFGGKTLEIPKLGYADPCTKDLIWRSHLYPPIKLPSLTELTLSIVNNARHRFSFNKATLASELAIQGGSK